MRSVTPCTCTSRTPLRAVTVTRLDVYSTGAASVYSSWASQSDVKHARSALSQAWARLYWFAVRSLTRLVARKRSSRDLPGFRWYRLDQAFSASSSARACTPHGIETDRVSSNSCVPMATVSFASCTWLDDAMHVYIEPARLPQRQARQARRGDAYTARRWSEPWHTLISVKRPLAGATAQPPLTQRDRNPDTLAMAMARLRQRQAHQARRGDVRAQLAKLDEAMRAQLGDNQNPDTCDLQPICMVVDASKVQAHSAASCGRYYMRRYVWHERGVCV